MIKRVYTASQLMALPEHGIEAQKIRALFLAYGGNYDFCRFFVQDNGAAFLAALDGSFVVCAGDGADLTEIGEFIAVHGFTDIFCSVESGTAFSEQLPGSCSEVSLMEYRGEQNGTVPPEAQPSEVWSIIGSRFEIDFEPWYLDMSHRFRHGVTRCYSDGKAALVVQHSINGEVLISQVSVLREFEGRGYAGGLLRNVCSGLSGVVQVVCEGSLTAFYEKNGFVEVSRKMIITA